MARASDEILQALTSQDTEVIDQSLTLARWFYESEGARETAIEGKLTTLLGFSGIATTVLIASTGFLLDLSSDWSDWRRAVIAGLFVMVGATFLEGIRYVWKGLRVSGAAYPTTELVSRYQSAKSIEMKKQAVADLLAARDFNRARSTQKALCLARAQWRFGAFMVTGVGLAMLSVLLGLTV